MSYVKILEDTLVFIKLKNEFQFAFFNRSQKNWLVDNIGLSYMQKKSLAKKAIYEEKKRTKERRR
uniref:Uncharacterized protein n=1 Tax=Sphingobacterium sp. (strain 21) TaxID=743722 RepID=F4C9R6_SPHS2